MKKFLALLTATTALGMVPLVSWAACVTSGEIVRISVNPGAVNSSFFVRSSTPGSVSFGFTTTDEKVVTTALTAQASHMRVTVFGNAAACGAVVNGTSAGGTVTTIITAP